MGEKHFTKFVESSIISLSKGKPLGNKQSSSFSPLSYIIQEAVNGVNCFLNFKLLLHLF